MTVFSLSTILGGDAGTMQTLRKMRQIANAGLRTPIVIEQARRIVENAGVMGRNQAEKYRAIRDWMLGSLQFMPDPVGMELLATPDYMVRMAQANGFVSGDCDDAAILGAALGKAVGLPAKFRALSFVNKRRPFQHVYTLLLVGRVWADLDTTRSQRFPPPQAARIIELGV
jgi:transglutaminase-like putative cysteine protease